MVDVTTTTSVAENADEGLARAWLALAAGDDRQHGGNEGYDDDPAIHYSWDSTVPNHGAVTERDVIVIWDKQCLIGASVIEAIESWQDTKMLHRCPACGMAGIKARRTITPRFKCYKCKATFDEPTSRIETITAYRSRHDAGWVDLPGVLSGSELRSLCVHPDSQLSIRPLNWSDFSAAVARVEGADGLSRLTVRSSRLAGGHKQATVRVRVGQPAFRRRLIDEFGAVCAFTGPAPLSTLEACHLYSYAAIGEHRDQGGLLLRRDIHRLFDLGLLAVDPKTMCIHVSEELVDFPAYAGLAGNQLSQPVTGGRKKWLADHWREHSAF